MKNKQVTRLIFPVLILFIIIGLGSCESEQDKVNNGGQAGVSETVQTPSQDPGIPLNKYTYLTNGYWVFEHRILVNEDYQGNPFENHWIDMHTDYTFDRGVYDEILYSGTYKYDHENRLLHLIPSDPRQQPQSEWKVLSAVDDMVLQGTHRFGNNNEQIKLKNVRELPQRPAN